MKKVLATALVATMGFAGVASAMSFDDVNAAQETLVEYGFSVDADALSAAQVCAQWESHTPKTGKSRQNTEKSICVDTVQNCTTQNKRSHLSETADTFHKEVQISLRNKPVGQDFVTSRAQLRECARAFL